MAIDRDSINEALSLGYSKITNSIIPDSFEFFWKPPAAVYDVVEAKRLLSEAGYPNGFDAGDYNCDSSFANLAEAVVITFRRWVSARGSGHSNARPSSKGTPTRN
jgi:peptide/nickel transport system substrate-binding protein